jgi:divalent metal cation (Fe/Co/Zn/Cd) transporter
MSGNALSPSELEASLRRGLNLEYVSIGWMAIECTVSVWAGIAARSLALIAFGGDSFVELISAYTVAHYLRKRGRVKNESGFLRKTELITSALLFALIPVIGLGAAYSFITEVRAEGSLLGITMAAGAVIIMPFLWMGKRRIGDRTDCAPLSNDAVESATCFFMSLTLLGGLLATFLFNLSSADYLATAIILVFVGREAVESIREEKKDV